MSILDDLKQLREETGVGVMDARKALAESKGDINRARVWLADHAAGKATKKAGQIAGDGALFSYVHQTGKVASLVKLGCETDFVARTDDFQALGKELAMQVAAMNPGRTGELLVQQWIRDPQKTVKQLIDEHIAKLGENIKVLEFVRMEIKK